MVIDQVLKKILILKGHIGWIGIIKRMMYFSAVEIIQVIDLQRLAPLSRRNRLNIYQVEKEHLGDLTLSAKGWGITSENYDVYYNSGCHGFIAEKDGKRVGYYWWGDKDSRFDFDVQTGGFYVKRIGLKQGDSYGFLFFIAPEYRGKGYSFEFLNGCFMQLKKLGYVKNYGAVRKDNISAYWTYLNVGYKNIGAVIKRRCCIFFLFRGSKFFFDKHGLKWFLSTEDIPLARTRA